MTLARPFRIGQIVPSSNTTMETEIPAMLHAREAILPERFTFHSSRMRMHKVTKEASGDEQGSSALRGGTVGCAYGCDEHCLPASRLRPAVVDITGKPSSELLEIALQTIAWRPS